MLGALIVVFVLGALVLSPFAFFQVITKAGFSGWWTFVPYSPWLVGIIGGGTIGIWNRNNESVYSVLNQLWLLDALMFLTTAFVMVMFFLFAFSEWPALQQPRGRPMPGGGFAVRGGGVPSWVPPPPSDHDPAGASLHSSAPVEQAPGWYKSGAVGAGEQSYWDGSAWTARRQWSGGNWVELPMPRPEQVGPEGAPASS